PGAAGITGAEASAAAPAADGDGAAATAERSAEGAGAEATAGAARGVRADAAAATILPARPRAPLSRIARSGYGVEPALALLGHGAAHARAPTAAARPVATLGQA